MPEREQPEINEEKPAKEATSEDDRKKFFELFYKVHGITDIIPRRIQLDFKNFDRLPQRIFGDGVRGGERRVFVIHDQNQNVIAGAELFMGEKEGRREAYFGHKIVDERHRGHDLGRVLVDRRLQIATESGCVEAWSLVERDNIAALRSINKDGFLIKGNGVMKTGNEVSHDTYYISRDLTQKSTTPVAVEDIERTKHAETPEQLGDERILIALNNKELIQQAFESEYIGRKVVLPKDSPAIRQPMIFMEKTASTEQNERENT